jgi:hypothetical protein
MASYSFYTFSLEILQESKNGKSGEVLEEDEVSFLQTTHGGRRANNRNQQRILEKERKLESNRRGAAHSGERVGEEGEDYFDSYVKRPTLALSYTRY